MATVKIHCQGDSIMEGYPLSAGQDMPSYLQTLLTARADGNTYTVTNTAFRNRTMRQIDDNYPAYVGAGYDAGADKNTLILWAGGNDIYFLADKQDDVIAAFNSIVSKSVATGYDEIMVMDIIQRGLNAAGTIEVWRSEAAAINDHFLSRSVAKAHITRIPIIDLYNSYDWAVDPWETTSEPDPLASVRTEYHDWAHPTAVSHSAEADSIEPLINLTIPPLILHDGTLPLDNGTTRYDVAYYDDYVLGTAGPVVSKMVASVLTHYRLGTVASGGQAYVDDGGGVGTRVQLETV